MSEGFLHLAKFPLNLPGGTLFRTFLQMCSYTYAERYLRQREYPQPPPPNKRSSTTTIN